MDLTLTDAPQPGLREAVAAVLEAGAEAAGVADDARPLQIAMRHDGAVVGGLLGRTRRGWLHIESLAVPAAAQRCGHGRALIALAEAEAVRRGCHGAYLDTVQFQAPGFYERLGYTEFGRTPDEPVSLSRVFFVKRFTSPALTGAWTVALEPDPAPQLYRAVIAPLLAYNDARVGPGDYRGLAVTVRDRAGTIVGGLSGYTWQSWMFVASLAAGPATGQGVGTALMREAEAEAARRGCIGIWLDTFTFQAPGFYEKMGYTMFGRLDDYPPNEARLFYVKRIDRVKNSGAA